MSVDSTSSTVTARQRRIHVDVPEDLAYWSEALGVSRYHLRKIIDRVGPMLSDVYYALGLREWDFPKELPQEPPHHPPM